MRVAASRGNTDGAYSTYFMMNGDPLTTLLLTPPWQMPGSTSLQVVMAFKLHRFMQVVQDPSTMV
jgi:hypothetical protein